MYVYLLVPSLRVAKMKRAQSEAIRHMMRRIWCFAPRFQFLMSVVVMFFSNGRMYTLTTNNIERWNAIAWFDVTIFPHSL